MTALLWSVFVLLVAHIVRLSLLEPNVPYALSERRIRLSLFAHLVAMAIVGALIMSGKWGLQC